MNVLCPSIRVTILFALGLLSAGAAQAQADPELSAITQIAPPKTNSTLAVPFGYVDLGNGNLHLSIPYKTFAGPNGRSHPMTWEYNSRTWQRTDYPTASYWGTTPNFGWVHGPRGGGYVTFHKEDNVPEDGCSNNSNEYPHWSNFAYVDDGGSPHLFPDEFQMNCNAIGGGSGGGNYALDASGYYASFTTDSYGAPIGMKVWSPSGDFVYNGSPSGAGGTAVDSNGTVNVWASTGVDEDANQRAAEMQSTEYVNVPYPTFSSGVGSVGTAQFGTNYLEKVTLPDGRFLTMTYDVCSSSQQCSDSTHLGTLRSLTLPTGGNVTFNYGTFTIPGGDTTIAEIRVTSVSYSGETADNCADASSVSGTTWLLCWDTSYQNNYRSFSGVSVTEPLGTNGSRSITTRTISPYGFAGSWYVTGVKTYAGSSASGTPLQEETYGGFNGTLFTDIVTKRDGVVVSNTHYSLWDTILPMISSIQQRDASNNILRETAYTFLPYLGTQAHPGTLANHFINRPFTMKTYGAGGAAGTVLAGAIFNYDETAPTSTSGFGNHSVMGLSWHDDANFGTGMNSRGNLTSVQRMSAGGAYVTTNTMTYNILGQLVSSTDGNGNFTNHDWYSDTFGDTTCATNAQFFFDAHVKNALNQQSATVYDSCSGTVHAQKTANDLAANRAGTVFQYDAGGRLTNTSTPDGGSTGIHYTDGLNSFVTTTVQAGGGATRVSNVYLDAFGRTSKTEMVASSADGGNVVTDTQVDFAGAPSSVHGPYTSTKPGGTATSVYDALHRSTSVSREGTVQSTTTYNGLSTTQIDGRGNATTTTNNLLGQLVSTLEAGSSSVPLNLLTEYSYDDLGNLASVNQHGAAGDTPVIRSFNYDPLSRLVQAHNPESGWVCYGSLTSGGAPDGTNCSGDATHTGYDGNNNLLKKVDARGATTLFSYDKLNRLTARGGAASSSINSCFLYDTDTATNPTESIGRLASEWTQAGSCPVQPTTVPSSTAVKTMHKITAYDQVGRIVAHSNCVLGSCSVSRTQLAHYNIDGSLKDFSNGLNGAATLSMGYDSAGRLSLISASGFTTPASMTFRYSPVGWSKARFGSDIFLNRYFDLFDRVTGMSAAPTD